MNERVRFDETGVPPDLRAPAQNPYYYFPPGSYPQNAAARPPIPQGYQQPAYQQPGYPQPAPQPQYAQPPYAQPEPAAFATIDDAVAQITARQRSLDGEPAQRPTVPLPPHQPPLPPVNYGPETYAPPQYRAPAYAPPLSPYAMAPQPEPQRYAPPPAPAPDLSGLESQLRNITAQIETLRQPVPDFSVPLRELRHDLAEISARLTEALPRRAVEALETEVRRLAERLDISRAAGVDPETIVGMERSLNELRDTIRSLKPAESLAGFEQAIRNLAERIDHAGSAYQDPASLQQLESSIMALRGIVANVASNDTLQGLAEEVRGLSARVERVASTSRGIDPEMLQSLEQRIASLPVLGAIERGFADLKARLDSIQLAPPQPLIDPAPAVGGIAEGPVVLQGAERAVDVFDVDPPRRPVEPDPAAELLAHHLEADHQVGQHHVRPLLLDPRAQAPGQELRIAPDIRHQVEHLVRAIRQVPRLGVRLHRHGARLNAGAFAGCQRLIPPSSPNLVRGSTPVIL